MRITSLTAGLVIVAALMLTSNASAAIVNLLNPGTTDFTIESITDLDIGSTFYDAIFHTNVSADSLPDPVITFTDFTTASAAVDVINAAILAATSTPQLSLSECLALQFPLIQL